jgi:hypothetical protein
MFRALQRDALFRGNPPRSNVFPVYFNAGIASLVSGIA